MCWDGWGMKRVGVLDLTAEQRAELESLVSDARTPARAARQCRVLLLASEGFTAAEIGRRCGVTPETVRRWRRLFETTGTRFIGTIAPGRGRKPTFSAELVDRIVRDTLTLLPDGGGVWSTRTMARRYGVSKDTVARIWRQFQIAPRAVPHNAVDQNRSA